MSRRAATFTQAPVVYFVAIGKNVKIGFSTNFESRLKSFLNSAVEVNVLLTVPGDRKLEKEFHRLLDESRVTRELFRKDWRVLTVIGVINRDGLEDGLAWLRETTPAAREESKRERFQERVRAARQSKAEQDAHYASLVADRKQRLGW